MSEMTCRNCDYKSDYKNLSVSTQCAKCGHCFGFDFPEVVKENAQLRKKLELANSRHNGCAAHWIDRNGELAKGTIKESENDG